MDPVIPTNMWIHISDEAEATMSTLADQQPYVAMGVALVDVSAIIVALSTRYRVEHELRAGGMVTSTVVLNWRTRLHALVNGRGAK